MQSFVDTQISFMADLSHKSCQIARRLNDLNLQLTQDLFDDLYLTSRRAAINPLEFPAIVSARMQPLGERLRSHQQQVAGLFAVGQFDLARMMPWLPPNARPLDAA
jgi:hypothetical protein